MSGAWAVAGRAKEAETPTECRAEPALAAGGKAARLPRRQSRLSISRHPVT